MENRPEKGIQLSDLKEGNVVRAGILYWDRKGSERTEPVNLWIREDSGGQLHEQILTVEDDGLHRLEFPLLDVVQGRHGSYRFYSVGAPSKWDLRDPRKVLATASSKSSMPIDEILREDPHAWLE